MVNFLRPSSAQYPAYGVPYGVTLNAFFIAARYPAQAAVMGFLLRRGSEHQRYRLKKRNGTVRDSSPLPLPFNVGRPMLGAPVTTAGNVLFFAATADNSLWAFNITNGVRLWEARLPAGGQAS